MSEKAVRITVNPDGIPQGLKDRDSWVCWRVETRDGDPTKVPVCPNTGSRASSTDDSTWSDFETALEAHTGDKIRTAGLGFMFSPTGPFVGVDLDKCRDPESGEFDEWAQETLDELDTFSEVSPSGTGAHAIGKGDLPDGGNRKGDVEMYEEARFFTVTGEHLDATPFSVEHFQDALESVHTEYIAQDQEDDENASVDAVSGASEPVDLDDRELLEKAKNADDGGKFEALWRGDTSGYDSHSEAVGALMLKLAFWTGGDARRMKELFQDSGLYPHPSKPGKLDRLMDKEAEGAIREQNEFYDPDSENQTPKASTDGGAAAAPQPDPSQPSGEIELAPWAVMELAFNDPYGRLERGEDADDTPTIHDLRTAEAATYVWDVMEKAGKDDVLYATSDVLHAYDDGVWDADGEQRLREYGRQALRSKYSSTIREELAEQTKARNSFHPEELGAPDGTFAVQNGLLHLLDGELEDLKRDHYAIRRAAVEYDPDAPEPTTWLEFLEDSIPKERNRLKFQEYCGYTLWHHAQPFGKALFLVGPTDSGKGTALKAIQSILGEDNVGHESLYDLIQTRWGPANIHDKAVNIRNEITPGGLSNVQRFKELTGGEDRINAEFKGRDKFRFTVTQKFLFATNQVPQIEAADEAFYNRCMFVRFPHTVPDEKQDPNLLEKLKEEKPGILNWMLDGLQRLMEQEHFTGELDVAGKKEICDAFGGVMERFLHNCVEITGRNKDIVAKSDLFDMAQAYADYIDKEPDWNQQQGFTTQITSEEGIGQGQSKQITGSKERVYTGIQVDPVALDELDVDVGSSTADESSGGQQTL